MGIVERTRKMILSPRAEWSVIANESASADAVFIGYALPLILISAALVFIGHTFVLGGGITKIGSLRTGINFGLQTAVIGALGIWLSAAIVNALASQFGSEKNMGRSMQLIAYAATPVWGGLLMITPPFAVVGALMAMYGIYMLWVGLPKVMHTPEDKATMYTALTIVVLLVIYVALGLLFRTYFLDTFLTILRNTEVNQAPLK